MAFCVLLFLFILISVKFHTAISQISFLEQPETQHALIGTQVNFTCRVEHATAVMWYATFQNGTRININRINQSREDLLVRLKLTSDNGISTALTVDAEWNWNDTTFNCEAQYHISSFASSTNAKLIIHTSLRPLPPSQLHITTIVSSILSVSWRPTLLWEDYDHIDYYNISVARKGSSSLLLSTSVESTNFNFSENSHPPCTDFEFNISAVSGEYGESNKSAIVGGFDSDIVKISQELKVSTNLYFRSNGSPIIDITIKLPTSVCSYQYVTINRSILTNSEPTQDTEIIYSEQSIHQGPDNVTSSVKYGLLKDENYTLRVTVLSADESVFSSTFIHFDTHLLVKPPILGCSKSLKEDKDILHYKIAIGVCLAIAIIICLTFVGVVVSFYVHNKRKTKKLKINDSTSRVCNAMVDNPIYDGPVYESVQTQFETLTKQTTSTANTSTCNSQPSTPTSSEKSIRYVDPPSSAHQASKIRSKSFLSHPSAPEGDTENIPRCTSVSVPVIKKIPKQRNKLHLTLTLTGTDSAVATEAHDHSVQNYTSKIISAVNPVVLRDVDDNYAVMSPATGHRALVGTDGCELSPEDTDKYKE